MKEETIRRTFNLNNYETQNVEGVGRDLDPRRAYLFAELDALTKVQATMVRVFGIRQSRNTGNDFDAVAYAVVTDEIQGIRLELGIKT